MVGLSIVLESDKATTSTSTSTSNNNKKSAQVINKVMITINNKPTPPASASPSSRSSFCRSSFLDHCFLCKRTLMPCTDIFMYQGDRAFCSEECRCRQIFMDEQNEMKKKTTTTKTATPKNNNSREKCSLAAMRSSPTSSPSSRKST